MLPPPKEGVPAGAVADKKVPWGAAGDPGVAPPIKYHGPTQAAASVPPAPR